MLPWSRRHFVFVFLSNNMKRNKKGVYVPDYVTTIALK